MNDDYNSQEEDAKGYMDKAVEKLSSDGKRGRKAFTLGLMAGLDFPSAAIEGAARKWRKKYPKDNEYFSMGASSFSALKDDNEKEFSESGFEIGFTVGILSGILTGGASYAATPAISFGNWIHRKIKKNRSERRY